MTTMENPYASPAAAEFSDEDRSTADPSRTPRLRPVVSSGLLLLIVGFGLSAVVSAINGWLLSAPLSVSDSTFHALQNVAFGLAAIARLGLGCGYLLCAYAPRNSNATQWTIIAAGVHFVGMVLPGIAVFMAVGVLVPPVVFWVFLHRIAQWSEVDHLRLLQSRLVWVGVIALGASITVGAMLVMAEDYDQVQYFTRVVGMVAGTCGVTLWSYYAWVIWQFRRQLS